MIAGGSLQTGAVADYSLNEGFGSPVVETATGGKGGGGVSLTPLG